MEQLTERKHLRFEAQELLQRPVEEKICAVTQDAYIIPYNLAKSIVSKMEQPLIRENAVRQLGMLA